MFYQRGHPLAYGCQQCRRKGRSGVGQHEKLRQEFAHPQSQAARFGQLPGKVAAGGLEELGLLDIEKMKSAIRLQKGKQQEE